MYIYIYVYIRVDLVWGLRVTSWDISPTTACIFVTFRFLFKVGIGFFPTRWGCHVEIHFRHFEVETLKINFLN